MTPRIPYERTRRQGQPPSIRYSRGLTAPLPAEGRISLSAPAETLDGARLVEVLRALHSLQTPLTLEMRAVRDAVDVGILSAWQRLGPIERAIRGVIGSWELTVAEPSVPNGSLALVCPIGPIDRPIWAPLRPLPRPAGLDPLAALLEAVQPLEDDEGLLIQYGVRLAEPLTARQIAEQFTVPAPPQSLSDVVGSVLGVGPRVPRFEPEVERALLDRLAEPAFAVRGQVNLVGVSAADLSRKARSLTAVFAGCFDLGFGGLSLEEWRFVEARPFGGPLPVTPLRLTCAELASLWHPPSITVGVPGVAHLRRPPTPLPLAVKRATGLQLGTHRERGEHVPVRLPRLDLQAGHLAIVGRTGVGKTTLVHQLLRQLIAAGDRPGIGVLDPHGDLVRDIAQRSIPAHREADAVLVELGDTDYPVGIPFFQAPGISVDALTQATFATIRLIFREQWSPTRMEDAVYAMTATLCRRSDATLLDVPRLFHEASFRRQAVSALDDPVAAAFWADYEALSEASQREVVRPILYRLRAFTRARAVRNLVCQTRGLDFREILEGGKILLVSLTGSEITAEADLLGELFIARLHLAALTRLETAPEARRPFFLAVDESQRFRGASLPILLSEGRKLGLGLLLSTQFLDAWGESLSESVLGNVGTVVAFRCGPTDSRRLQHSLKPFTPDQIEDLDRHEAVAKLQIGGVTVPAFDFQTEPLRGVESAAMLARMRARTRERYARPRRQVEAEFHPRQPTARWESPDVDEE